MCLKILVGIVMVVAIIMIPTGVPLVNQLIWAALLKRIEHEI